MKLSALEYFIALAESKSINQAAQKLYISQPSLTKSLQSFEREIGVQIFYRDKSGIVLTEAGKKILPDAKQVISYYNSWKNLSDLDPLRQISIYTHSVFNYFLLPDILLHFKKTHPDVAVNLTSIIDPEQYVSNDVRNPIITVSTCTEEFLKSSAKTPGISRQVLLEGEYHCLMSAQSPLAKNAEITLEAETLNGLYFTMPHIKGVADIDFAFSALFQDIFKAVPPPHNIEAGSLTNVISMLCKNPDIFTVAYYPVLKCWDTVAKKILVHRPFKNRKIKAFLCVCYSERAYRQHSAVRDIVRSIKDVVAELRLES